MGCCNSVPCPYPQFVGLWISDDATNKKHLLANHKLEKEMMGYRCSKFKVNFHYKECNGAVLEVKASGYVNYIEMEGVCARSVYSGPITNWDGPDGTWTGCCGGCDCCPKGCVHFTVIVPHKHNPTKIHVNGRAFSKSGSEEEKPVVVARPISSRYRAAY